MGRTGCTPLAKSFVALVLVLAPLAWPGLANATCNVIPTATTRFRGALGTIDRPFAIPSEVGDDVTIQLEPFTPGCDGSSAKFLELGGESGGSDDYFVTVLFEPPAGAARHAIVLTTAATPEDRAQNLAACQSLAAATAPLLGPGGSATCRDVDPAELVVVNATTLRFRFPDTDAEFALDGDDLGFTGPATIAVTAKSTTLPFGLASARCAGTSGVVACIDELYASDGSCETGATHRDPVFGYFTALPVANDYRALCTTAQTECTGLASQLGFTVDAAGNALIPINWRGVLLRPEGIPVPRLVRGRTGFAAFAGGGTAVRVPGRSFLASYSPGGRRLPPVFDPLSDPTASAPQDPLLLFGSVDGAVGVIRIARRMPDLSASSPVYRQCAAGANAGLPCLVSSECPGGTCGPTTCRAGGVDLGVACQNDSACASNAECGPGLFDFSGRLEAGVGPVLVPSDQYALDAENPVPLDGLIQNDRMFAFVQLERIAGTPVGPQPPGSAGGPRPLDLNGDGDMTDAVLVLRDRETGVIRPIGPGGAPGLATTRIQQPPFRFSAVSVEGDVVGFLESEPLQGDCSAPANCDHNGDGDAFDTLLRVYRMTPDCGSGTPCAQELTATSSPPAVDAAPLVEHAPVIVSNGLVFFRTVEADAARQSTIRVTSSEGPSSGGLAANGRFVGLALSCNTPPCNNDSFVYDRDTDANGVYDEPGKTAFERISVAYDGGEADGNSTSSHLSADGRYALFGSSATNLMCHPPPRCDSNDADDVFVRDRATGVTIRMNVTNGGGGEAAPCFGLTNGNSGPLGMSLDGRFVAFTSRACNLAPGSTQGRENVFVHDRDPDGNGIFDEPGALTRLVSADPDGEPTDSVGISGSISGDGHAVAFSNSSTDFVPTPPRPDRPDLNGAITDLIAYEADADRDGIFYENAPGSFSTTLVSVDSTGHQGNSHRDSSNPKISDDGRFVALWSDSTDLVPGDTNGVSDIFLHDRDADGDGIRDENDAVSTTCASVNSAGEVGNLDSQRDSPNMSRDARLVSFFSSASNLVAGDTNGFADGFVHDRLTGHTARVSVDALGQQLDGDTSSIFPSNDGRFVSFTTSAPSLVGPGGIPDVFVRGIDTADLAADLSGDGVLDDTVLQVVDTTAPSPQPVTLGPAEEVRVASASAAFLRPESATGIDRNGDGDRDDAFVYLSVNGGPAQDLDREARAISLSESLVAALVPSGSNGATFVEVYDRTAAAWISLGAPAARSVEVVGSIVAFVAAGSDHLFLYDRRDPGNAVVFDTEQVAREFVLGDTLVAFRTPETQSTGDFNGDGDTSDQVLQVYDFVSGRLFDTGQAVIPCRLVACDPRVPYRVAGDVVTFLTLEGDQGGLDLDGNGDGAGTVVQTFNAREAARSPSGASIAGRFALMSAVSPASLTSEPATAGVRTLGGSSAGICADTGKACSRDADCGVGVACYMPPGGCIRDEGTNCDTNPDDGLTYPSCAAGSYCVPLAGTANRGRGTCHTRYGGCAINADCASFPSGTVCQDVDRAIADLIAPVAAQDTGERVFEGGGVCAEDLAQLCSHDADCVTPNLCGSGGTCMRPHEACRTSDDCGAGLVCEPRLISLGVADVDGDGVPDPFDNCPMVANPDQAEAAPGVGRPCNHVVCRDGLDNDGDENLDLADPGCRNADDPSEEFDCSDGIDDDGDGRIDYPSDPGCPNAANSTESPVCQDGLDNDGDGKFDFDGGASTNHGIAYAQPDPNCTTASRNSERPPQGCGLGAELALAMGLLSWVLARRGARRVGVRTA